MKKQRFSVEQIVAGLKQAELGLPAAEPSLEKAILQDITTIKWNVPR